MLDVMGEHAVSCHDWDDMISRHARKPDNNKSACWGALLSPICEQKSLRSDNNSRPGKILLPVWNAAQPAALDFTVTSPLQSSLVKNASEKSCFALSAADDWKDEHYYAQKRTEIVIQLNSLALKLFGGFSETVR